LLHNQNFYSARGPPVWHAYLKLKVMNKVVDEKEVEHWQNIGECKNFAKGCWWNWPLDSYVWGLSSKVNIIGKIWLSLSLFNSCKWSSKGTCSQHTHVKVYKHKLTNSFLSFSYLRSTWVCGVCICACERECVVCVSVRVRDVRPHKEAFLWYILLKRCRWPSKTAFPEFGCARASARRRKRGAWVAVKTDTTETFFYRFRLCNSSSESFAH